MSRLEPDKNPHRLYRDKDHAIVAGVCAGIANYFGFNRKAVRIIFCFSFLFVWPVFIYLLLAILIPKKPEALYTSPEQENFWRGVSNAPSDIFGELRLRFRDQELRLQRMERYVTSREYEFDRELNS